MLNLFGAIAADHAIEVGLGFIDGSSGLRLLGFQLIAFEADEERSGGNALTFFDGDGEDTAADFGADLDFAGFDSAGVGAGGAVLDPGDDDPNGDQSRDDGDGDEDTEAVHASGHH